MTTLEQLELRIKDLENRVASLESCFSQMENQVNIFGDYKNRTAEELKLIEAQLDAMLDTLDSLINDQANQADRDRAKALKKRLKQNKTRARNAGTKHE
ncbi:hypothetical protein CGI81_24760 [Vibrio parahaemolyticus]|uniref:hypothetical protein n=1 Tax=Vibrio parahaemolyticus TaxID=670 RepID=UPI00112473A0|nr:hypothetical protein [Vibrio parahaemolyticus]TOH41080.1 hypothetical protein CGI81_24760 [Vibrio parahaemolyticus]